jgi:NAD(P)H-flavin reductase
MDLPKPQTYRARVSDKYFLTENERFLLVKLELVEPERIHFVAGQYVSVEVSEQGERRSYSIASTPDTDHGVTLVVEMVPQGKGSAYWREIVVGVEVRLLAPLGRFVVDCRHEEIDSASKLLFVATGSGIVPIWSMIHDLLLVHHETRPIRLHWGMRSEADLFWVDNLERLAEEHPNFVFDIVLSQPSETWSLCRGHVQDCLRRDFATEKLSQWHGYVCGSPEHVSDIASCLTELGMYKEHIQHERFSTGGV